MNNFIREKESTGGEGRHICAARYLLNDVMVSNDVDDSGRTFFRLNELRLKAFTLCVVNLYESNRASKYMVELIWQANHLNEIGD